ncbi:hypothetical protein C8Q72DRAFT_882111 [Fomitopsis betulina]|nr:hypothetical protein C8Q72DRAFT_882111 [Fomitopsis betulina]
MFFKDWETSVYCDGDMIDEYDFRIVDDETVSCYIPSEAGKNFAVKWRSDLRMPASAQCYMDGHYMGNSTVEPGRSGARNGIRTDACYKQYFQFASLATTDDDDAADPEDPSINSIGVIEVRVYRVRFSHEPYRLDRHPRPRGVADRTAVHERSKKAGSHCVKLGDGKWCEPLGGTDPGPRRVYIDGIQHPYIRFIFRYQPRAMLQAHGIILRDNLKPSDLGAYHPRAYTNAHAGPSGYHTHSQVKAEPRPLEERLGSEYYDDMQVENMLRSRSVQYYHPHDVPPARPLEHAPPTVPELRRHPFVIDVDADVIDLTQDDND